MERTNRRDFLKKLTAATTVLTGVGTLNACAATGTGGGGAKYPNIVYILADDMGYGDLSCLNKDSKIPTPNMDRLAAEGVIFTDAHSGSAVCTPTRYGVLTGRYSWRSTLKQSVLYGYSPPLIPRERMTVASFLKPHGYRTACVGKWHLGWTWPTTDGEKPGAENVDYGKPIPDGPTALGFDYFFGISASLDMDPYVYVENDRVVEPATEHIEKRDKPEFWRAGPIAPGFTHKGVLPTFTEKAVACIDRHGAAHKDAPLFLYIPLAAPHTPIVPNDPFLGMSKAGVYGDFVCEVDWSVGQVIEALERNGMADNTLIIVTSDNGCSPAANFGELHGFGHHPSYHFRGHKADIYEGGHRIPFIVRWPERVKADMSCDDTICLTDLMATASELVGVALPGSAGEDSVSMLPALLNQEGRPQREATVHHSINGSFSIRQGKWKLELCPGSGGWSAPKPAEARKNADLPPVQLYDLTQDIGERENVCEQHPDVVRRLVELLQKYVDDGRSTVGPPQQNEGETSIWGPGRNAPGSFMAEG